MTEVNEKKTARLILGIETSCDETAAAVVDEHRTIHANAIFAQLKEHAPYGGVVPEIAARAHMEHIERVVDSAMQEANVCFDDLDAIAVTTGPGLIGGVIVGVMTAKSYASVHHKPLIAVNHLEGHALTVRLTDEVAFPYLLLLVSGGHCQLLIVRGVGNYQVLGGTIDDALGEAFDKTAKLMGLGYPGGPVLEKLAKEGDATRFTFPRPLCDQPGCDFSFSGLKTAVRQRIEQLASEDGLISAQDQADVAAAFQVTVADVLKNRLTNAIKAYHDAVDAPLTVVMAGGVAANLHIREALQAMVEEQGGRFVVPPVALCTDNAAMIAWAGMERLLAGAASEPLVEPRARWPLTEVEAL